MNPQRHQIRRQVFDVTVPSQDVGKRLHAELGRLQGRGIEALIDRCCTELGAPDRLHRIDALVVDLGELDIEELETDLLEKLGPRLREALAEQIREADERAAERGEDPESTALLELVSLFAQTGHLPWWADASRPGLFDETLEKLLARDAPRLCALVRALAQDTRALVRIVRHARGERLLGLFRGLMSFPSAAAEEREAHLRELLSTSRHAVPAAPRTALWASTLRTVCHGESRSAESVDFWQEVLAVAALESGATYSALVTGLHAALTARRSGVESGFARVVKSLSGELRGAGSPFQSEAGSPLQHHGGTEDTEAVRRVFLSRRQEKQAGSAHGPNLHAVPSPLSVAAGEKDTTSKTTAVPGDSDPLQPEGYHGDMASGAPGPPTPPFSVKPPRPPRLRVEHEGAVQGVAPAPSRRTSPAPSPIVPHEDPDEIYVDNAGLVLLWPFLRSLFERTSLLVDAKLRDHPALHRAVGLVQHLATQDMEPPEYQLALPKVLCGMPLNTVFDFGPPVTEQEFEECATLLAAVLLNAPQLGDISVDVLRRAFLLRKGVLRANNGAYLLGVERAPYDMVLDRLPWAMSWVRLPWMEAPLSVEWGS